MERTLYSVSDLVSKTKTLLELSFKNVWVEGEVSNVHYHSSGHLYFTIKDSLSELKCIMFKSSNSLMRFQIENGMRIASLGSLSMFEKRGQVQFIIKKIEISGIGTLHQAFESLKNRLDKEGLFSIEHKIKIKKIPKKIGIVTSGEGAALKDIIHVIRRRSPYLDVVFRSAKVQGEGAAQDIANGIIELAAIKDMDTIIVGRGGGSIEDLWAFNNESLAREIFDFPLPIISGVGHEIDFTITDFVSDLRAPTPTAAAELVTENYFQLTDKLQELKINLHHYMQGVLTDKSQKILLSAQCLKSPLTLLKEQSQSLDNFELRLFGAIKNITTNAKQNFQILTTQIYQSRALQKFVTYNDRLNNERKSLKVQLTNIIEQRKLTLQSMSSNLKAVSPLAILDRGYSIVMNDKGQAIKSSKEVKVGDIINTRLAEGELISNVSKKN